MKGLFIPANVFLSVIYFSINHFSLSLSISTYLCLFLRCSFLSLRQNELIQMRLSVGFPASFSPKGRKEPFFLSLQAMFQDLKHETVHVCIHSVYVHTRNVYM